MAEALGLFVLGLVLLALGGDSLVKGASGIAQRFGVTPFTTGLLLVAFATSLPELAVNLQAIVRGQEELALGNAIGSNVANVGLTLAVAALAAPVRVRWRALGALWWLLVLGTGVAVGLGADGLLSRAEGVALLLAFVAVCAYALARSRHDAPELREEIADYARTSTDPLLNLIRAAIGAGLLWMGSILVIGGEGAHLFGWNLARAGAAGIGEGLGLSPLLTGLLPVAVGTALPEAAAAIAAARRGQGDMVVGHVIGASAFNLFVIVGGMAAFGGLALPATALRLPMGYELLAALAFAAVLYPMLRSGLRVSRRGGGFLLLAFAAWAASELWLAGR